MIEMQKNKIRANKLKAIINPKPLYIKKPKRHKLIFADEHLMIGEQKITYESIRLVKLEEYKGKHLEWNKKLIYLAGRDERIRFGIASFHDTGVDGELTKQVEALLHALCDKDMLLAEKISESIHENIIARKKQDLYIFLILLTLPLMISGIGVFLVSLYDLLPVLYWFGIPAVVLYLIVAMMLGWKAGSADKLE